MKLHINLVCLQCGTIADVDDSVGKELIRRLTDSAEFTVQPQYPKHRESMGYCLFGLPSDYAKPKPKSSQDVYETNLATILSS